jgi:hypothetical protein
MQYGPTDLFIYSSVTQAFMPRCPERPEILGGQKEDRQGSSG